MILRWRNQIPSSSSCGVLIDIRQGFLYNQSEHLKAVWGNVSVRTSSQKGEGPMCTREDTTADFPVPQNDGLLDKLGPPEEANPVQDLQCIVSGRLANLGLSPNTPELINNQQLRCHTWALPPSHISASFQNINSYVRCARCYRGFWNWHSYNQ